MRQTCPTALLCMAAIIFGFVGAASHADEATHALRIGVFYDCLSIRNGDLQPGTPVAIIRFNSEEENQVSGDTRDRRFAARIIGKADTATDCPTWVEDRTLREDGAGLFLYTVSPEIPGTLESVERGIGMVGIRPDDETPIDLDGNGVVDTFSIFVTLGGLVYEVWRGEIWIGPPLWTGSWHFYHGPDGPE